MWAHLSVYNKLLKEKPLLKASSNHSFLFAEIFLTHMVKETENNNAEL